MKTRLNLTIEENLLDTIKQYAVSKRTSVSELVEGYFKTLTKTGRRKNILKEIEGLKKPDFDINADLEELFYLDQSKKYGF
jgi:hypothetical protein